MASKNYEEALTSFILDDDKLVTYKWLSNKLKIHINNAKNILKEYWEKYKNDKKIVATFLIIGQLNDRNIHIEVVKESNLILRKQKFINIDCEHLYSLQKCLKDTELLALEGTDNFSYGAIKYNPKYVKTNKRICNLQNNKNVGKEDCEYITFDSIVNKVKKEISKEVDCISNSALNVSNSKRNIEKKVSFLGKSSIEVTSTSEVLKSNDEVEKLLIRSNKSEIHNFFIKESNKSQEVNKINEIESNNKFYLQREERLQDISRTDKTIYNKLKFENNQNLQTKKRIYDQEKNTLSKRRKIIALDSSEDGFDKDNIQSQKENKKINKKISEVATKNSQTLPTIKHENNKLVMKKKMDKTFKDENGYLVTKRIHVHEITRKDDNDIEIQNQESPNEKSGKQKIKKQTTLNNFFKKF